MLFTFSILKGVGDTGNDGLIELGEKGAVLTCSAETLSAVSLLPMCSWPLLYKKVAFQAEIMG